MSEPVIDKDYKKLDIEYKELHNHIRECWKYISELLKSFIYLQIILISIIFLGSGVVKIEGIVMGAAMQADSERGTKDASNATPESSEPSNFPDSKSIIHKSAVYKPTGFDRLRKFAIIPLILLGIGGSWGAIVQNHRLFNNAKKLVRRAAFLEENSQFPLDPDNYKNKGTVPAGSLLFQELYSENKSVDLKSILNFTYGLFGCLWVATVILLII